MSSEPFEPPYELIHDRLQKGRVIPFLGAGASLAGRPQGARWESPRSAFLPTASELADYLDRRSGFPSEASSDLARISQYFDGVAGRGGLDDELHEIFARAYQPSGLHDFLASLDNVIVVTTNYDQLMEEALARAGKAYHRVIYNMGSPTFYYQAPGASEAEEIPANELDFETGTAPVIYKMHGSALRDRPEMDSYVITEDDYVEFLARMAGKTAIPAVFGEPFRRSHFLFLGYGLRDWNLRVVLHKIWKDWPQRRFASWAIQHQAQPLEREFWTRRNLTIYELSIEGFLEKLRAVSVRS